MAGLGADEVLHKAELASQEWRQKLAAIAPVKCPNSPGDCVFMQYLQKETLYSGEQVWEDCDEEVVAQRHDAATTDASERASKVHRKSRKFEDRDWIRAAEVDEVERSAKRVRNQKEQIGRRFGTVIDCEGDTWLKREEEEARRAGKAGVIAPNQLFCLSRIWAGGWGAQCTAARLVGFDYCLLHHQQITRQGYLTHGRIDGKIPPKKRLEFESWQAKLQQKAAPGASSSSGVAAPLKLVATMTDDTAFSEEGWRAMGRGAGESKRAFSYRTGEDVPLNRPWSCVYPVAVSSGFAGRAGGSRGRKRGRQGGSRGREVRWYYSRRV